MIRSSSRSLYKLRALCSSSPSVPLCRSLLPSPITAIRRFSTNVAVISTRETGNFSSLVSLRSRYQVSRVSEARSFASKASRSTSENASEFEDMTGAKIVGSITGAFVVAFTCDYIIAENKIFGGTTPSTVFNKAWWEETDKKFQTWPRIAGPAVVMNPISRQNFLVKSHAES